MCSDQLFKVEINRHVYRRPGEQLSHGNNAMYIITFSIYFFRCQYVVCRVVIVCMCFLLLNNRNR